MSRKKSVSSTELKAETRNRALATLARMRRKNMTLAAAAREENIDPRTVKKYFGTELKQPKGGGPIRVSKSDRRSRQMVIPTSRGTVPVAVKGSDEASQLGRYMSAVGRYVRSGDTDSLEEFEGQSIGGHRLITDPDALSSLSQAGALELDDIYAAPEASS